MPPTFATLLLTRPKDAAQRFLQGMGEALPNGLEVVISPLIEVVPTGHRPDYAACRGVIFSSANAVRFGGKAVDVPAWCVGPETTKAAQRAGWNATQAGDTAEALYQTLTREKPQVPLLHVGGVHRRGDLAARLTRAGLPTGEADVYDQPLQPLNTGAKAALAGAAPVIVPLFSPRTARQFAAQVTGHAPLHIVALSKAVGDEVAGISARSRSICPSPDGAAMQAALVEIIASLEARARAK